MDRADITSGGAFRSAVRSTFVFICVLLIGTFIALNYFKLRSRDAIIVRVTGSHELMAKVYADGGKGGAGRKALLDLLAKLESTNHYHEREVSLFDSSGQRLFGNLEAPPKTLGWREMTVPLAAEGPEGKTQEANYLLYSQPVDDMILEVGYRLDATQTLEKTFLKVLWGLGLLLSVTFLAIGYFTSLGNLAKLQKMTATLDRVAQGDTQARLETLPQNDQIDRVSRAMNVHLDRLSTLMATTRATAAAIAHDLRTPLSRAYLAVDQAQTYLDKGEDPRVALAEVEAELTRLRSIFDVILRISRLENAVEDGDSPLVPIAPLLADLAETFGALAEERGQDLVLSDVTPDLAIKCDAGMLSQLMANLIQNAITHCPAGTAIKLGAVRDGDNTALWVADTGPGIPEAERERVFELFYSIDPNRTGGSNGLGLALVKAIVDRLGGRITLSDAGPGLRVDITLPAARK